MSKKSCTVLVLLYSCLVFTLGCGARGDGYSGPRGKVTGTATIDGKPLQQGCQIVFISTTGGYTASGVIGEGGKYTLNYAGGGDVPAVEYEVQFTAPVSASSSSTAAPVDPTKMAESLKIGAKMKATTEGPVPTKYQSTLTSKMSFTVKAGDNTADFDLKTGG